MAFKIPSIPPTTNKTVRFPNDLIAEVEQLIEGRDCTFSAFVIAAVRAAVEEVQAAEAAEKGGRDEASISRLLPVKRRRLCTNGTVYLRRLYKI